MFIDIHAHTTIYPRELRPIANKGIGNPDELVAMYDAAGIDMGCILPATQPEPRACIQSNEDILAAAALFPDRLIPFCGIDPRLNNNSPEADLSYPINHYKEKGCKGIGEITANLPIDDPRCWNLFRHAAACRMPLTFHLASRAGGCYGFIDEFGLPLLEKTLQAIPDVTFLAHSQPFWAHISGDVSEDEWAGYPTGPVTEGGRVPELLSRYPGLIGDLSAGSGYNAVSRDPDFGYAFLEQFQDKLCWGTDCYKSDQADGLLIQLKTFLEDGLAAGRLSQQAFDKITHQNAQRILGL